MSELEDDPWWREEWLSDVHGGNWCDETSSSVLRIRALAAGRMPWSWASLPGILQAEDGYVYVRGATMWGRVPVGWPMAETQPNEPVWLTSERRPS